MPAMVENVFIFLILTIMTGFVAVVAWAGWSALCRFERARKTLAAMACPNCKASFGAETVANAEAAYKAHVAELWKKNPGIRFRLVCLWFVTCPKCGWKGDFSPESLNFVVSEGRHNKNLAAERTNS